MAKLRQTAPARIRSGNITEFFRNARFESKAGKVQSKSLITDEHRCTRMLGKEFQFQFSSQICVLLCRKAFAGCAEFFNAENAEFREIAISLRLRVKFLGFGFAALFHRG
jgi:hypothetical protein